MPTTTNYDMFKLPDGKRDYSDSEVNKVMANATDDEGNLLMLGDRPLLAVSPVLVNDKMEILDGRMRFRVMQELGLPITYKVIK